jgi:hypothetical protein
MVIYTNALGSLSTIFINLHQYNVTNASKSLKLLLPSLVHILLIYFPSNNKTVTAC